MGPARACAAVAHPSSGTWNLVPFRPFTTVCCGNGLRSSPEGARGKSTVHDGAPGPGSHSDPEDRAGNRGRSSSREDRERRKLPVAWPGGVSGAGGGQVASRCGSHRPQSSKQRCGEAERPGQEAAWSDSLLTGLAAWSLPRVQPLGPTRSVPPPGQLPCRRPWYPCVGFTFRWELLSLEGAVYAWWSYLWAEGDLQAAKKQTPLARAPQSVFRSVVQQAPFKLLLFAERVTKFCRRQGRRQKSFSEGFTIH